MTVEKINMTKLVHGHSISDDRLEHFITEVATMAGDDVFGNLTRNKDNDVIFDVEMKINGYHVPVQKYIDFIVGQFDRCSKEEAYKIIENHYSEKVHELGNIIDEHLTNIKSGLRPREK